MWQSATTCGPATQPRRVRCPLLALLALAILAAATAQAQQPVLEVFSRSGCPHCARAEDFLAGLERRRAVEITRHDVSRDPAARTRLQSLAQAAGVGPGVPAFYARGRLLVGFRDAETTGRELEALLFSGAAVAPPEGEIDAPFFGTIRPGDVGLPLFTVVIGLLDGFNPCAMWVLLFLLSLLAHLKSRSRMLLVGGVFVAVSGIVYYAFLTAWLGVFLWIGLASPVRVGLGVAAVAIGVVHLKDALAPGTGPSLHIPARARPRIYAGVRRILSAENLPPALVAVVVLAFLVNTVELLCTAGLPAIYTRVLTLQELPGWRYYAYLGLYDLAYLFDDTLVLLLAVAALGTRRLSERAGRWLDGLSGCLLIALGALLALRPEWLMRLGSA
jgi:glutaredoxin